MPYYKDAFRSSWTSSTMDYGPHQIYWSASEKAILYARGVIKTLAQDLDSFHAQKKQAEKNKDYDTARHYRELISNTQADWRAWKLLLGYFVDEKNLPYIPICDWPESLTPSLDWAYDRLSIEE